MPTVEATWHSTTYITKPPLRKHHQNLGLLTHTSGTCLAISGRMTIVAELALVASSVGISMVLARLALGQLFVLVQMGNRHSSDAARVA